jgi:hypothetical protein
VLSLAESLDSWLLLGFRHDGNVVFLASEYRAGGVSGEVITAVIEPPVYDSLVEMSRVYWAKLEAATGPGHGPRSSTTSSATTRRASALPLALAGVLRAGLAAAARQRQLAS